MQGNRKRLEFLSCHKTRVKELGEPADCPIWVDTNKMGLKYKNFQQTPSITEFWSPRAGGYFELEGALARTIGNQVELTNDKISLSRWIAEKNIAGQKAHIKQDTIEEILSTPVLDMDIRYFRVLESHYIFSEQISNGFARGENDDLVTYPKNDPGSLTFVTTGYPDLRSIAVAYCECSDDDFEWLKDSALNVGALEHVRGVDRLTPKGLSEIQSLKKNIQSEQAFVAMWFDDSMKDVYNKAIKPAIEAAGYNSYRVDDDRTHSDQITNKILAEIKNSKFLIADFTHGDKGARGGVYFEAGYAQGLGIPVLWLIKDNMKNAHFDTNHYPHIIWEDGKFDLLKENIKDSIIAHQHIGKGPK